MDSNCISYKDTGFFSQTVIDYLDDAPALRPFYSYRPSFEGFGEIIQNRKVTADTNLLVEVLRKQYEQTGLELPLQGAGELGFTVTTGHQLNIFAGPLYFIYKIVTAIKLSRQLKERFPDKNFTPVYWMATEDHDFAEINYTKISGIKVQWQLDAAGATGRLLTKTIRQALNQYKGVLGLEQHGAELAQMVETAYTKFDKLADATRYLVHQLFGQYGLVIVDADDPQLKRQFAPIIEQDIIQQNSFKHISETDSKLHAAGVHTQIHAREINFFYLTDNLRERLSFEDGRYLVLNTEISFSEDELKQEIKENPERFSPNVAMRPLYQEAILPNIAYIGGGAEVVYWLQLKANFDHYGIDFPILLLRNSGLLIRKEQADKIAKLQFSSKDLFKDTESLKQHWVSQHSDHNLTLTAEWQQIENVFAELKQRVGKIDSTLVPSTAAVESRFQKAVDNLEKKLMRAEKRNYVTRLEQIEQIKTALFPGGSLQERTENFGLYFVKWGQELIEELIRHFEPLDFEFCILTE